MNYYDLPFVSRSELSEFRNMVNLREMPANLQAIYDMGNLVDYSITEEHKIGHNDRSFTEGDRKVYFTEDEFESALLMKEAYNSDPIVKQLFTGAIPQYMYFRNRFKFTYEGMDFYMPVKIKYDLIKKKKGKPAILGGDIKTTACVSQEAFDTSITYLDYDLTSAWYMDIANIDRHMIIGLSKKKNKFGKHQVFRFVIKRGDATYNRGLAKYQYWAFKYYHTIYNLNL